MLGPYYYLLFDWAYSASQVSPIFRQRFPDTRSIFLGNGDSLKLSDTGADAGTDPAVRRIWTERSFVRALATTPDLADLLLKQIGDVELYVDEPLKPAHQAYFFIPKMSVGVNSLRAFETPAVRAEQDFFLLALANRQRLLDSLTVSCGMSQADARRVILATYVRQALADADAGNLHRAHVLLSDVLRMMNLDQAGAGSSARGITALFDTVVNQSNLDQFTQALTKYVEDQANAIVVSGEDASVLHAAGLRDGAEFIRTALLAKYQLLVMPLVTRALSRAGNAGYRPPEGLLQFKKQMERHVQSLRGARGERQEFMDLAARPAAPTYAAIFGRFRDMWTGDSEASLDKTLKELQNESRSVEEWYQEKRIAAANCPLQFLSAGLSTAKLSIGLPIAYDEKKKKFREANVLEFVTENETLGKDIKEWCLGNSTALGESGREHFVLGWYWLETGQPALARQSWIAGARQLIGSPQAVDAGGGVGLDNLLNELNAYRLLVAASFITAAPPGVIVDRATTYEAEVRAIATDWISTWTLNGYPKQEAQTVIDSMFPEDEESLPGDFSGRRPERYAFFDYRFKHGSVPDVVVSDAVSASVFNSDGLFFVDESASPPRPTYERIGKFFRGYTIPSEYSDGSKQRWKKD